MLRVCIIIAFCVWASQAAYTVEEFNKRQKIVNGMNAMYQQFLKASVHDTQNRKSIETQMMKSCDTEFDNSDTWFVDALNDPTGSLIETQLKSNNFNISDTEKFISSAFGTVEMAINMGFWCSVLEKNEKEASRLVTFKETVLQQKSSLTKSLTDHLLSAFKEDVTNLIDRWLEVNDFRYNEVMQNFMKIAADELRKIYPVGVWLTVAFHNNEKRTVCARPGTFSYSGEAKPDWTFQAFLLEDGQKYDVTAVADSLNGIQGANLPSNCLDNPNSIFASAKYECNSDKFTFFGVFSNVMFASSDPSVFQSRKFTKSCSFYAGILA